MNRNTDPKRIIVIGTSAGGPGALRALVAGLEAGLPAAVLVVQHLAPDSPQMLPDILSSAGPLPATLAQDGEAIVAGKILLAPPDRHLMVWNGTVRVTRGPRENRSRPSIDVLFRSAAVAYNTRTVGVLLTGMLDDGVVGLRAVKQVGGITIVQEPAEATYPDMVERALATTTVDYQLPVAEIAALLNEMAHAPVAGDGRVPERLRHEVAINLTGGTDVPMTEVGEESSFSCPACGGRLWRTSESDPEHYLCEVGHSYNPQTLLQGMDEEVERSLWVALRTLEERIRLLERMAVDETGKGRERAAADFRARAAEVEQDAQNVRRFLLGSAKVGPETGGRET